MKNKKRLRCRLGFHKFGHIRSVVWDPLTDELLEVNDYCKYCDHVRTKRMERKKQATFEPSVIVLEDL